MSIDQDIVLWINGQNSAFMDEFMRIVSLPYTWIPLYGLLIALLWYKTKNWNVMVIMLVGFGIAVGLSDFTCSGFLKPLVRRFRPMYDPELRDLHIVEWCGGRWGFCSSHAANSMCVALLFSLLYRNRVVTGLLMSWVLLVCYSRMYLGAHYPTDILAGLAIGSLFAVVAWLVLTIVYRVDDVDFQRDDS